MATQPTLDKFFTFSPSPTRFATERSPSSRVRKRMRPENDSTQTIIDAGQTKMGLELCLTCGMAYNIDHEGDVKMHEEFHNRDDTTKGLQLKPKQLSQWKETVKNISLPVPVPSTLFFINEDTKVLAIKKKIDEITKAFVNEEVGFCDDVDTWEPKRIAMLYVSEPKNSVPFIAGVVLVDLVDKICLHPDGVVLQQGSYVGINRIWIHQSLRRKGVATMLVNTSRRLINPKAPVDKTKVAFFAPSGPGLEFVLAYYGSKNGKYLTYDY